MPSVNIKWIGEKELEKKLGTLADNVQKNVVRQSLRKEAKNAKERIVSNIARKGLFDSGVMLDVFTNAPIKSAGNKKILRVGPVNPARTDLGIHADDKYYYPYAVEFGHNGVKPYPFIRPAIDDHKDKSIRDIGSDIGKGIVRQAKKKK